MNDEYVGRKMHRSSLGQPVGVDPENVLPLVDFARWSTNVEVRACSYLILHFCFFLNDNSNQPPPKKVSPPSSLDNRSSQRHFFSRAIWWGHDVSAHRLARGGRSYRPHTISLL